MLRVYRKRDDLPMLTLPLVVLLFVVITGCTMAAASVMRDGWLANHAIPGFLAALPLFCLAIAAYGILIVLWRQAASMAVSVTSVLAAGFAAGWFLATVLCLSVFACAYVYASAFLLRQSRYRRIVHLTTAVAVCLFAAGLLFAGFVWHGVPITELPMQIYTGIAEIFADSAYLSMTTESALSAARSVTIALPALWLVIAEANAWLCDWICRRLFRLMDCERYFLPAEDEGITTPRYFGVLVLLLSFLLLTTSYRQNPRIYAVLTNCVLTIFPAATYVGLHEAALRIRDRLTEAYLIGRGHRTRTVVVIALLLLWSTALFGGSTLCFLFAIYGAWQVLKHKKASPSEKTQ